MLITPIRSSKLFIRELNASDIKKCTEFINLDDAAVLKWLMPHKLKDNVELDDAFSAEIIEFYKRISKRGPLKSIQILHIFRKHSDEIIGICNTWRDVQGSPRVATYIIPKHRRKGYGSEAHIVVLKKICSTGKTSAIIFSQTEGDNKASQRKMIANGFTRLGSRKFSAPNYSNKTQWVTYAQPAKNLKRRNPC